MTWTGLFVPGFGLDQNHFARFLFEFCRQHALRFELIALVNLCPLISVKQILCHQKTFVFRDS